MEVHFEREMHVLLWLIYSDTETEIWKIVVEICLACSSEIRSDPPSSAKSRFLLFGLIIHIPLYRAQPCETVSYAWGDSKSVR